MHAGSSTFYLHLVTLCLECAAVWEISTQWTLTVRPRCRLDPASLLVTVSAIDPGGNLYGSNKLLGNLLRIAVDYKRANNERVRPGLLHYFV